MYVAVSFLSGLQGRQGREGVGFQQVVQSAGATEAGQQSVDLQLLVSVVWSIPKYHEGMLFVGVP
jgi:hypothetical protein